VQITKAVRERAFLPIRSSGTNTGIPESGTNREFPHRTSIQISGDTKSDLDRVKQEAGVRTYDDAIRFLLQERKKSYPSTFGLLAGAGPFVRDEEGDSHRIRH
jgi:hypothetical protein